MTDQRISGLTEATIIEPADELVVVQGGVTKKVSVANLTQSVVNTPSLFGRPDDFDATYDCDFVGDIGAWTAVAGTESPVDLLETNTAIARYDVDSVLGHLLMQAGHGVTVSLRADVTLAVGEGVTACLQMPGIQDAGDNLLCVLGLNANDTSMITGEYFWMGLEQDSGQVDLQSIGSGGATGGSATGTGHDLAVAQHPILVRAVRLTATTYWTGYLMGGGWVYLGTITTTQAMSNVWLTFVGPSSGQTYQPVAAWDWIKFGGNGFKPW